MQLAIVLTKVSLLRGSQSIAVFFFFFFFVIMIVKVKLIRSI